MPKGFKICVAKIDLEDSSLTASISPHHIRSDPVFQRSDTSGRNSTHKECEPPSKERSAIRQRIPVAFSYMAGCNRWKKEVRCYGKPDVWCNRWRSVIRASRAAVLGPATRRILPAPWRLQLAAGTCSEADRG